MVGLRAERLFDRGDDAISVVLAEGDDVATDVSESPFDEIVHISADDYGWDCCLPCYFGAWHPHYEIGEDEVRI